MRGTGRGLLLAGWGGYQRNPHKVGGRQRLRTGRDLLLGDLHGRGQHGQLGQALDHPSLVDVSVASRRRRRRCCWDVKTGKRDGGVLRLVPDVVGISGTWGSRRRRHCWVGSTGTGAVAAGWAVAAQAMRHIHLLKAGVSSSWPSCTSSSAVNGCISN